MQSIPASSDRQEWTVASSTPPQTISSSASVRQLAVPVVDMTAQDSPMVSVPAPIEYVESSPRQGSSISSEDLDLAEGIAQARAIELHLAAEEAEQARVAIAARREAAAAQRRVLEARTRSSRNTSGTSGTTRSRGTGSRTMNRPGDDHAARGRAPDPLHGPGHDLVAPELPQVPERTRAIPGAGVWDFLFPPGEDNENGRGDRPREREVAQRRDHNHGRAGRGERHRDTIPPIYNGMSEPDDNDNWTYQPTPHHVRRENREKDRQTDEQLRILKERIAELEASAKTNAGVGPPLSAAGMAPSDSSGFHTPRQSIDAPLIDLSSPPPKKKIEDIRADMSLLDMPATVPQRGERRGVSRDRGSGMRHESPPAARQDRGHRASKSPERDLGQLRSPPILTVQSVEQTYMAKDAGRMDLHPLMVGKGGLDATKNDFVVPPPGLGAGAPKISVALPRPYVAPPTATKVKEADEIKIPALPEMGKFTSWKQQVRDNVMSASGRGRDVYPWILETERMEIDFEGLADTAGLDSLDVKLSAAINRVKKGRIEKMLTTMDEN